MLQNSLIPEDYFSKLFLNPSFTGALLGALITGMISLTVFKLDKRNIKLSEFQHYEKVYNGIKRNLNLVKKYSLTFKEIVIEEKDYHENELEVLNKMFYFVSHGLEKIDIKDIPYDIHINFTELKDSLQTIKLCSEIFVDVGSLSFLKEDFIKDIDRFIVNLNEFEKYFEQ